MSNETSGVTWVFDCDGVLLDSNDVKTEAFRVVTTPYGHEAAEAVVAHHLAHGGISRFVKLERLFSEVLRRPPATGELEGLLEQFAQECQTGLAGVASDPATVPLLEQIAARGGASFVVSGGAEDEVRWALGQRGLVAFLDAIHGSPTTKADALHTVLANRPSDAPSVYVGDSRLDMEVATDHGMHAVFVTHWSEFSDWREYVHERPEILVVEDLGGLRRYLQAGPPVGGAMPRWVRSLA